MKKMIRLITICMILFFACSVKAQTSGDRLFSQGLELQKKQTVHAQKSAIAKFQSAKKLYDSAAKKKQCDDAIMVSYNIIKTISSNKGQRVSSQTDNSAELKSSVLELSNEKLQLDNEYHSVTVNVTTTETDWSVTPISNNDGFAFISVNQHTEEHRFDIICSENLSTRQRTQSIEVRAGDLKKVILVEQSGKPIILSVEKTVVEISNKGGNKSIQVYSNSDSKEEDNNNRNWKVVSKPEWVNVIGEEIKDKGLLGKLGDKAKGLVKKNSASAGDPSVITSVMKLVVASKPKNDPSRSGEIVICSENQQATIIVQQK